MRVHLPDPAATHALGVWLGERVLPGSWIALVGDLGAGKTALTKGLAEGLEVSSVVQSPTFVLVQQHRGRLELWHADYYRLGGDDEVEPLGLHECPHGVVVVEWADRFPHTLPDDLLRITLTGEKGRTAEIVATGPHHRHLVPDAE